MHSLEEMLWKQEQYSDSGLKNIMKACKERSL